MRDIEHAARGYTPPPGPTKMGGLEAPGAYDR